MPHPSCNLRMTKHVALLCAILTSAVIFIGCASPPKLDSPPTKYTYSTEVKKIYVYSFLDFREREFGKMFIGEFKNKLISLLKEHNVPAEQLNYGDSPLVTSEFSKIKTYGSGVAVVPVMEVIMENAENQKAFNPTHILLVLPTSTVVGGSRNRFTIRWVLKNTKSYSDDWIADKDISASYIFSADENYLERAQQLATYAIDEMVKAGAIH
jgi:hypothetical protein